MHRVLAGKKIAYAALTLIVVGALSALLYKTSQVRPDLVENSSAPAPVLATSTSLVTQTSHAEVVEEIKEPSTYEFIGDVKNVKLSEENLVQVAQLNLTSNTGLHSGNKNVVVIDKKDCDLLPNRIYKISVTYNSDLDRYGCFSSTKVEQTAFAGKAVRITVDGEKHSFSEIQSISSFGNLHGAESGSITLDTTNCKIDVSRYFHFQAIYDNSKKSYICYNAYRPEDGF